MHPGPPSEKSDRVNSAQQLCLACGLCCDGTLFNHVRLGPEDDAKRLKAQGLPVTVSRTKPPVTRFPQPCGALCVDRTCRVYADRPRQCRSFECGVYKDALAGRISFPAALRSVRKARRQADHLRQLLHQLGETDEQSALTDRFQRAQRRVESGKADPADGDTYAELSLAMHHFSLLAHRKFYTRADTPPPEQA